MWDILLATIEETKALAGSILTANLVRLQMEYLGTRKTKITLHRVPLDIEEDHLWAFLAKY